MREFDGFCGARIAELVKPVNLIGEYLSQHAVKCCYCFCVLWSHLCTKKIPKD